MATKRKRVCLSIQQKVEVIQRVEDGEGVLDIALEFGVGQQTVRDLMKKKDELLKFALEINANFEGSTRKKLRRSQNIKPEETQIIVQNDDTTTDNESGEFTVYNKSEEEVNSCENPDDKMGEENPSDDIKQTKRKRVCLSIQQKLDVIHKAEEGGSISELAKSFGIGAQTVRDFMKRKNELLKYAAEIEDTNAAATRKSLKKSQYDNLDEEMIKWLRDKRAEGVKITGQMCIEQAKLFYQSLGIEKSFNGSFGWLNRFKQRFGITDLSNSKRIVESTSCENTDLCNSDSNFEDIQVEPELVHIKSEITCSDDVQDEINDICEYLDSNTKEENVCRVPHNIALDCVNVLLEYLEQHKYDYSDILHVKQLKANIETNF